MKCIKKLIILLILATSLIVVAPDSMPVQNTSVVTVQAKTKYVYATKTGMKYHCRKCGNGKYYKITLKEAKNKGLKPCEKCYSKN